MVRKLAKTLVSPTVAGLLGVIAFLAILQIAVVTGVIPKVVVAKPTAMFDSIPELVTKSHIITNFFITFGMTLAAIAIAISLGVPFGYLMYKNRIVGEAYEGWLAAMFAAPIVLLYPLFLVIMGRTYGCLILMGFLPGLIPIAIQTRQGLLNVNKTLLNVGRSFNLSDRDMFWKIMIPGAAPNVFNGIRLGVMYTLVNIVAIEYLVDFGGLGRIVSDLYFRYEIPAMYAAIGFVILVSVIFYWAFGRMERWMRPA